MISIELSVKLSVSCQNFDSDRNKDRNKKLLFVLNGLMSRTLLVINIPHLTHACSYGYMFTILHNKYSKLFSYVRANPYKHATLYHFDSLSLAQVCRLLHTTISYRHTFISTTDNNITTLYYFTTSFLNKGWAFLWV